VTSSVIRWLGDLDSLITPPRQLVVSQITSSSELEVKADSCFPVPIDQLLTIGEVAKRSGVAASALRFYEDRGLIESERAGSGHRRYRRAVLRRIAFIVFAQRIGLTLEEIKEELDKLPGDHAPNRRDWSRLSAGWTSRIDERIAELERLRAGLTECIGCGCLSLGRCQLANPGDRAGRAGPGPRYWVGDPRPA
jgi:MerR family redox-sensitive transcriptional activator SoxR